jgi:hypothetical protein
MFFGVLLTGWPTPELAEFYGQMGRESVIFPGAHRILGSPGRSVQSAKVIAVMQNRPAGGLGGFHNSRL